MNGAVTPFRIDIPQPLIDAILARVWDYEWHEQPAPVAGEDPWTFGTELKWLRDICSYWLGDYDWRAAEAELNAFPQFIATVGGHDIHFIHERSAATRPEAVILTHGWPGSIVEFLEVIEPLAHPERFGGDAADGIDVIVPSLIGYGFSGKPDRPLGPRHVAALWDQLMRETLGYRDYIAQGGDFGAMVTTQLGARHAVMQGGGCKAVHVNMFGFYPGLPPETRGEIAWATGLQALLEREGAYSHIQYTKPQTLSFALMDSPVGQCAWILEKFHGWTDRRGDGGTAVALESVIARDRLLTNVMIYLVTRSFNTAAWMYRGFFDDAAAAIVPVAVPCAIAAFPCEFVPWPPRSYVDRHYDVVRWTDFDHGGHFAALEAGLALAADVRAFVRQLRDSSTARNPT